MSLELQTVELLKSILDSSPDAEMRLQDFSRVVAESGVDDAKKADLSYVVLKASNLLALERQLDPARIPVVTISQHLRDRKIPSSEVKALRNGKKRLTLWMRHHLEATMQSVPTGTPGSDQH